MTVHDSFEYYLKKCSENPNKLGLCDFNNE